MNKQIADKTTRIYWNTPLKAILLEMCKRSKPQANLRPMIEFLIVPAMISHCRAMEWNDLAERLVEYVEAQQAKYEE